MRGMFSLVGLLVVVGILLLIFKMVETPTLEKGRDAHNEAQQMSGRGQDGQSVINSFKTEPQMQGNKLTALLVTDVTPDGAADQYYGLKKGDQITSLTTQAGLQKIGESSNGDPEMAKDQVQTAFQASQPIVVMRGGQLLTLPLAPGAAAPPAAPLSAQPGQPPAQQTQSPAQAKPQAPRNIYEQVDGIKNSNPNQ
jgi:hypothetical protein